MFCKECGVEIPDDSKFCSKCGSVVTEELLTETSVANSDAKLQEQETQTISPKTSEDQEWFFYEGTDKRGPYSYIQMVGFVKQGKIQRETLVWMRGLADWIVAEQSPLSQEMGSVTPAAPIGMISDKWLWGLAAGSTALSFFVAFGLAAMNLIPGNEWIVTIFVVAANIFFLTKDMEEVKKSGRDVESWMYMGFVLVPVYLFVRAKNTSKNYAPLIVWCIINLGRYLL